MGEPVRYDGGHKRNDELLRYLAGRFELMPLCPEAGFGVPRPAVELVLEAGGVRAVGVNDRALDVTEALLDYARTLAGRVPGVCGLILKSRSPSCGIATTPIHAAGAMHYGSGLFAQQVLNDWPGLPLIDEEGMGRADLRQRFLQQVECYGRKGGLGCAAK